MTGDPFILTLALLIGVVIIIAALLSELIGLEKKGLGVFSVLGPNWGRVSPYFSDQISTRSTRLRISGR